MGPVTIAVDSYGPVTDNAQSVFELSTIETIPGIKEELKKTSASTLISRTARSFWKRTTARHTFKATAKPVLIGTAVVALPR